MTITRETLELAALAAGIPIEAGTFGEYQRQHGGNVVADGNHWAPHTNIADAVRLAVRLRMTVITGPHCVIAKPERVGDVLIAHDGTQADAERAYYEAVTVCAAGIASWCKIAGECLKAQPADVPRTATDQESARAVIKQCRAALAEELSAWDIDPPLHHVKEAHDACVAWLAGPNVQGNAHLTAAQEVEYEKK